MSLRRAIKAKGLGNFLKLGIAMATSAKVAEAPRPANESLRAARVSETGLIGRDVSRQFEIYAEVARVILGCEKSMVNLLDGACGAENVWSVFTGCHNGALSSTHGHQFFILMLQVVVYLLQCIGEHLWSVVANVSTHSVEILSRQLCFRIKRWFFKFKLCN